LEDHIHAVSFSRTLPELLLRHIQNTCGWDSAGLPYLIPPTIDPAALSNPPPDIDTPHLLEPSPPDMCPSDSIYFVPELVNPGSMDNKDRVCLTMITSMHVRVVAFSETQFPLKCVLSVQIILAMWRDPGMRIEPIISGKPVIPEMVMRNRPLCSIVESCFDKDKARRPTPHKLYSLLRRALIRGAIKAAFRWYISNHIQLRRRDILIVRLV
jgi:hypothetical protein